LNLSTYNKKVEVLSVIVNSILYEKADKNGYTDINSGKFSDAYDKYEVYINYLIHNGIIERNYYIVGKKCYGYRFSEIFKKQVQLKRIIYYPVEKGSEKKESDLSHNLINIDPFILKRLKKDFNSCSIHFDLEKNQIEKTYDEWGNFIDIGKWFRNNLNLHKWHKGFITFCFKTNRLYTNFTNLSKYIRLSNIALSNENLIEFDIPNSFPLMVGIYMRNENPDLINDYDFQQYCTSVTSGTFYSSLKKGLNAIRNSHKTGNENDYSSRLLSKLEVKQIFQVYLNGDYKRHPFLNGMRPFINEYMSLKYPCVHEKILEIKKVSKNNVYDTLVRIETQFVFELIKELYNEYINIKILTCHDSIYVPISYRDRVQAVWDNNMKELIKDLPNEECEDDLDLPESRISIVEEVDNSKYMYRKNEKDISFFDDDDEEDDYLF